MKKSIKPIASPFRNYASPVFAGFLHSANNEVANTMVTTDLPTDISFIDFDDSDEKLLSYVEGSKIIELATEHGYFTNSFMEAVKNKSNRTSARAARVVKRALPTTEFAPADIEKFTNLVIANKCGLGNFELNQGGAAVRHAYYEQNYFSRSNGILGGSCMKYEACQEYLDIYDDSNVKILVLKKGDMVAGRAIVWLDCKIDDIWDGVVVDRIYTNKDADTNLFHNYIRKQGWAYRTTTGAGDSDEFTIPDGEGNWIEECGCRAEVVLNSDTDDHSYYPYMDTFMYTDGYRLSNRNGNRCLSSTEGVWDGYDSDDSDW